MKLHTMASGISVVPLSLFTSTIDKGLELVVEDSASSSQLNTLKSSLGIVETSSRVVSSRSSSNGMTSFST